MIITILLDLYTPGILAGFDSKKKLKGIGIVPINLLRRESRLVDFILDSFSGQIIVRFQIKLNILSEEFFRNLFKRQIYGKKVEWKMVEVLTKINYQLK
jgi:hypothetical protein